MKLKTVQIRCNNCGTKIEVNNNQCEYTTSSHTRSAGNEIQHSWVYRSVCDYCKHNLWFEYQAWEYPETIINWRDKEIHNARWLTEPVEEI